MTRKAKNDVLYKDLVKAIAKANEQNALALTQDKSVEGIMKIVEQFIAEKQLVCYGGTAINNILPKAKRFYDSKLELPDYDFFSPNALDDAIALADIYQAAGYSEVEAKAGVHFGTYKVFVNFIPVADITQLPPELFETLRKEALVRKKIRYAPPEYLQMAMYLELSRPKGDVSRWEKVLHRLSLLNESYPIKGRRCGNVKFSRKFDGSKQEKNLIIKTVKDGVIDNEGVFFGAYAVQKFNLNLPKDERKEIDIEPDFDVLSLNPLDLATKLRDDLIAAGFDAEVEMLPGYGEIIATHYEVRVNDESVAFVYEPLACHNYNIYHSNNQKIRVATVDTMLSLYLAFLYSDRSYHDKDRIYCMCKYIFSIQMRTDVDYKGLMKRFTLDCIGHQKDLGEMRAEKSEMFAALKSKRGSKEYDEWFLRYIPGEKEKRKTKVSAKTTKKKTKTKVSAKTTKNKTQKMSK